MKKGITVVRGFEADYLRNISEQYTFADIARRFGITIETREDMLAVAKMVNQCMLADVLQQEAFLNLPLLGHFFNREEEAFAFDVGGNEADGKWYHALCLGDDGCSLELIDISRYERMFGSEYRTIRDVACHMAEHSDIMRFAGFL